MEERTNFQIMIAMIYFSFTTLSTVGLGDFSPRSNLERVVGAFFMLFGAMITSLVMQGITELIEAITIFNKSFELNDKLSQFIETIEKFNND